MSKVCLIIFLSALFPNINQTKLINEYVFDYLSSKEEIDNDIIYNYFPNNCNMSDIKIFNDPITKNKHFVLKQSFNGINVFGKTARLHINQNKKGLSFSSNFFNGAFNNDIPSLSKGDIYEIINIDFNVGNKVYKNNEIIYYVLNEYAYLSYQIDAITYSEAYRYIVNAHTGEIIKKWTLVYEDGAAIGQGENLLGEWVDELHIYEGASFTPTGDLITPYLVCEEYCFDYGDCGGDTNSGCELNPSQGSCPDNYIEDCNDECFHEWYLQFPGVGNGFCNDPWINVQENSIEYGNFNMVDESNLDLGAIFTINSYGGFYENLSYINSDTEVFSSSFSSLSHASGVSAHNYQRNTLDYFWDYHNYAGIDGNGKRTISVVNYGSGGGISQNNAFFNAGLDVLSYGIAGGSYRPFCAAQDIVTHEFTHGFTSHTSGLIYENQPGAMNESMSDVFGYFVEAEFQNGGDWTEGEDIRINGGASRSFSNPPTYGDPDNLNHPYYVPFTNNPTFANDNGGVHSNSGIINKILYLVVQGDEHYGINVLPLDNDINQSRYIASDIWFNWNKYYLDSEDDFIIGREKMLQVTMDLFSENPFHYETIANAWASVGVGNSLLFGDLNTDSIINIQDIIILIGSILGSLDLTQEQQFVGDSNMDNVIDVLDIVFVINTILGNN